MSLSLVRPAALLFAGVLIGVSFVAQPLKFNAEGVPLAHLVSAGSAIFHGSHVLQGAMLVALLLLAVVPRDRSRPVALAVALALSTALVALGLQLALMPSFDARVAALAAGHPLPAAPALHAAYAALELLKLAALLTVGWPRRSPALRLGHGMPAPTLPA